MSSKKDLAVSMLKSGKSYSDVCQKLKVAKSTLNGWFSSLTEEEKELIKSYRKINWLNSVKEYQEKIRNKTLAAEKNIQNKFSKDIGSLNQRELLLVGTALYWGEGSKSNRWQIQFSNSDPKMVKIMIRYLIEICKVPKDKLYFQMILHPNISEQNCLEYWSKITGVSKKQFKKACYATSKTSQQKRGNKKLPYGTLQIRVLDKKITHQIYGYILGLKEVSN
ncbi:MAG: hypothetical protein ACOX50_04140 [Patescibacteria group bacterium]|jgi:transposase-like protein